MPMPRKLLSISHSYVVRMNRRLLHELAIAGQGRWEVTGVAPAYFHGSNDIRPITFESWPDETEPCRVEVIRARMTSRIHCFTYGPGLSQLLQNGGWDLVHAWEEPYILVGGQIACAMPKNVPLVYRTAQSINKHYPPPFSWIEKFAMRRAAGWICSGQTVAAALSTRKGYWDRPMRRIPLGVDLKAFEPNRAKGLEVLQSLAWDESGPPVIGYLGRFSNAKGIRVLTRALDRLDQMNVKWRALFIGGGRLESELHRWAARHEDRVRICTDVRHDDVPRYMNAMDLLAAPSLTTRNWREQFGRMIIEAFASGVPVVGSDSGEIPYLLENAGAVAAEGDVDAWVGQLGILLENKTRRDELRQAGIEHAQTRYAWPIVARQYLDFFDQFFENSNGRRR